MVWFWTASLFALAFIGPVYSSSIKRQATVIALSDAQISGFAPFTHFASTAYCNPSTTINWTCGGESLLQIPPLFGTFKWLNDAPTANCAANPDFEPVAAGGDGDGTQFCKADVDQRDWECSSPRTFHTGYVGFSPSLNTVIVAHEGTIPSQM
jgi:hypothetical protein